MCPEIELGAERERGAICCPVELSSLLTDSFRETDEKLLSWLKSEFQTHLIKLCQCKQSCLPFYEGPLTRCHV